MAKTKLCTFYMGLYGAPIRNVLNEFENSIHVTARDVIWRTDLDKSIT